VKTEQLRLDLALMVHQQMLRVMLPLCSQQMLWLRLLQLNQKKPVLQLKYLRMQVLTMLGWRSSSGTYLQCMKCSLPQVWLHCMV
jgi:hypothetical protein